MKIRSKFTPEVKILIVAVIGSLNLGWAVACGNYGTAAAAFLPAKFAWDAFLSLMENERYF